MAPVTRRNRAVERQMALTLARHLGSMELATTVVKAGIVQVGALHRAGAVEVARTLEIAEQLIKAAAYSGRLTPAKRVVVQRLTEAYLEDMFAITDEAAKAVMDVLWEL